MGYEKQYYLYMMTNANNTVLYTGVTNNLVRRIHEHKEGVGGKFTSRYQVNKLVYFEVFADPENANQREKQIKAGSRSRKIKLIESINPAWQDLSERITD
jgi:putative endonuclease